MKPYHLGYDLEITQCRKSKLLHPWTFYIIFILSRSLKTYDQLKALKNKFSQSLSQHWQCTALISFKGHQYGIAVSIHKYYDSRLETCVQRNSNYQKVFAASRLNVEKQHQDLFTKLLLYKLQPFLQNGHIFMPGSPLYKLQVLEMHDSTPDHHVRNLT